MYNINIFRWKVVFIFVFVCCLLSMLTIVKLLLLVVRRAAHWPPPRCGHRFPLELAFIYPKTSAALVR